jgi:hypothetical protein
MNLRQASLVSRGDAIFHPLHFGSGSRGIGRPRQPNGTSRLDHPSLPETGARFYLRGQSACQRQSTDQQREFEQDDSSKVCWILVAAQLEYPNRRGKIPQKRFICAKQQIFVRVASLIVATSPPVIL